MEFAAITTKNYCGIDLHARKMFVTIMAQGGKVLFRQNMDNNFDHLHKILEPYGQDISVGVESTYNWYWLADACHKSSIPFYLGHAFYMKAVHGGKKKNDKLDSKMVANLLRCNLFPMAYAYPETMRATRDLLRRRKYFSSLRAGCYTHIQNTFHQQGIIDVQPKEVKRKSSRRTLPGQFEDVDLEMNMNSDFDIIETLDRIIVQLEKQVYQQAKHHDRKALSLLKTIPGVDKLLSLTILYEIHTISRFKSRQQFSSYARLVKVDKISSNKKIPSKNRKIGNPYLKYAIGEIIQYAPLTSRFITKHYEKLKSKFGPPRAKSIISHKFGTAIYYMLKNGEGFDENRFIR